MSHMFGSICSTVVEVGLLREISCVSEFESCRFLFSSKERSKQSLKEIHPSLRKLKPVNTNRMPSCVVLVEKQAEIGTDSDC